MVRRPLLVAGASIALGSIAAVSICAAGELGAWIGTAIVLALAWAWGPALSRAWVRPPRLAAVLRRLGPALPWLALVLLGVVLFRELLAGHPPATRDHAIHYFQTHLLVDEMLPSGRIVGWSERLNNGYTFGESYPILGYFWMAALHLVSFGVVSLRASYAAGIFAMWALAAWGIARMGSQITHEALVNNNSTHSQKNAAPWTSLAGCIGAALWLLDPGGSREGGWNYLMFHGVWPQLLSTALWIAALPLTWSALLRPSPRRIALAGGVLGLSVLAHPFALLTVASSAAAWAILLVVRPPEREDGGRAGGWSIWALIHILAGALCAGWLAGFLASADTMGRTPVFWKSWGDAATGFVAGELFTEHRAWVGPLALIGLGLALRRGHALAWVAAGLVLVTLVFASDAAITTLRLDLLVSSFKNLQFPRFAIALKPLWFALAGVGAGVLLAKFWGSFDYSDKYSTHGQKINGSAICLPASASSSIRTSPPSSADGRVLAGELDRTGAQRPANSPSGEAGAFAPPAAPPADRPSSPEGQVAALRGTASARPADDRPPPPDRQDLAAAPRDLAPARLADDRPPSTDGQGQAAVPRDRAPARLADERPASPDDPLRRLTAPALVACIALAPVVAGVARDLGQLVPRPVGGVGSLEPTPYAAVERSLRSALAREAARLDGPLRVAFLRVGMGGGTFPIFAVTDVKGRLVLDGHVPSINTLTPIEQRRPELLHALGVTHVLHDRKLPDRDADLRTHLEPVRKFGAYTLARLKPAATRQSLPGLVRWDRRDVAVTSDDGREFVVRATRGGAVALDLLQAPHRKWQATYTAEGAEPVPVTLERTRLFHGLTGTRVVLPGPGTLTLAHETPALERRLAWLSIATGLLCIAALFLSRPLVFAERLQGPAARRLSRLLSAAIALFVVLLVIRRQGGQLARTWEEAAGRGNLLRDLAGEASVTSTPNDFCDGISGKDARVGCSDAKYRPRVAALYHEPFLYRCTRVTIPARGATTVALADPGAAWIAGFIQAQEPPDGRIEDTVEFAVGDAPARKLGQRIQRVESTGSALSLTLRNRGGAHQVACIAAAAFQE